MGRGSDKRILSTMALPHRAEWVRRVDSVDVRALGPVRAIARLLSRASRYDAIVLDGSSHVDELAAALIARLPRRPPVILADATWKRGDGLVDRALSRAGIRAIDGRHVTYCVHSSHELESFPRTWGVDPRRVAFTPWPYSISDQDLARPIERGDYIFAGGNSLRDYGPLLEAACGLPMPVTIASSALTDAQLRELPPNVTAGPVSQERYDELMLGAGIVVVPIEPRGDRGAGQTTYVNAMVRAKPVVVTDVPGARDYITDGETGLIVAPRDAGALTRALRRLLDDPAAADRMGARAREAACERFSPDQYVATLLEVVDRVLAQKRGRSEPGGREAPGAGVRDNVQT